TPTDIPSAKLPAPRRRVSSALAPTGTRNDSARTVDADISSPPTANALPASTVAVNVPASSGPIQIPAARPIDSPALVAVNSSGERVSHGTSAGTAGWISTDTNPSTPSSRNNTTSGIPPQYAAA